MNTVDRRNHSEIFEIHLSVMKGDGFTFDVTHLHNYLLSVLAADVEKTDISSGRADIYIPRIKFRLIIELKRIFKWTDDELRPFLTQAIAYGQTDIRLGVLGVLDLSDRPPSIPHIDKCFEVVKRKVDGEVDRTALMMRVPGNVRTPSNSK